MNDTLWVKARIHKSDKVMLWLGANVMLEYETGEAKDLLEDKLKTAKTTLGQVREDLEFLREQITTIEVNFSRRLMNTFKSMPTFDSVFCKGAVALITGAAGGIGKAAAVACASRGMDVVLVDRAKDALSATCKELGSSYNDVKLHMHVADVTSADAWKELAEKHGQRVNFLFLNAGAGNGGGVMADVQAWHKLIEINFFGVLQGVQTFLPHLKTQQTPAYIVITGSKQGITTPPGNLVYNCTKSLVKVFAEGLQHELRSDPAVASKVSAHLLVPGWTNTEFFGNLLRDTGKEVPPTTFSEANPASGAWMPSQVVDYMFEKLKNDKFYIICPDNETSTELDKKRIEWTAGDIINDRTPLSRWDPAYAQAYQDFLKT
ncbi:hypothetical protein HK101_007443 [Irineochytrium annulatum]|nr:hypothetical protein HK101_007443 [Irineochytrium annulatum]